MNSPLTPVAGLGLRSELAGAIVAGRLVLIAVLEKY
jgi:hypothetical protein